MSDWNVCTTDSMSVWCASSNAILTHIPIDTSKYDLVICMLHTSYWFGHVGQGIWHWIPDTSKDLWAVGRNFRGPPNIEIMPPESFGGFKHPPVHFIEYINQATIALGTMMALNLGHTNRIGMIIRLMH